MFIFISFVMKSRILTFVVLGMLLDNVISTQTIDHENNKFNASKLKQTKKYLISLIKNVNHGEKMFDGITSGIYKVNFHAVLNALYDLLTYWGCKPMAIVFEPETQFDYSKLFYFFDKRSPLCRPKIFEIELEENICSTLIDFRYFVYIGHKQPLSFFTLISNCSELFTSMRTWIVISEYQQIVHFDSPSLRRFVTSPLSQITFFVPLPVLVAPSSIYIEYGMTSRVDLYDVFYSPSTLKTEVIPFAYWTPQLRLYYHHRIQDNQGLRGRLVRFVTLRETCPMVCFNKTNSSQMAFGYSVDLFSGLEKSLNANHHYEILEDRTWGISSPNGSFNGFIGRIQRGETDASLIMTSVLEERKVYAVRYSETGLNGDMRCAIKQPLPFVSPTIYFLPFEIPVWSAVIGSLILSITVMMLMHKFYQSKQPPASDINNNKMPVTRRKIKIDFFDQDDINGLAEAIVMLTLYIAVLMVFTYYTSILTSVFAYRDIKLPFNTMEELANMEDYKVLTIKDTSFHKAFENAKDGPYKAIWKKFQKENKKGLVPNFLSTFELVAKGSKLAYFTGGFVFRGFVKKRCDLTFTPEKYLQESYNFPFRKDFPFYKVYSISMWKLLEGGVAGRLEKLHLNSDYDKCENLDVSLTLELKQTYFLFVFLLGAFGATYIALLIEKIIYKNRTRQALRPIQSTRRYSSKPLALIA